MSVKTYAMLLLMLQVPEMVFMPSLDFNVPYGFYDLVDGLVGDIYRQSSLIPRLASHSGQEHYQVSTIIYSQKLHRRDTTKSVLPITL